MNAAQLDTAALLVTSAAGLHDPSAELSPSLWQRVVPLLESIQRDLVAALGPGALHDFRRLGQEPYQPRLRAELCRRVHAELARVPELEARLRRSLLHLAEFGRLLPHHGAAADALLEAAPLFDQARALSLPATTCARGAAPEISVVLSFRCRDEHRLRNLLACIASIRRQTLERRRYSITAVEQDDGERLESTIAPLVDHYIFARNRGGYNYAWGRNVGVRHGARCEVFCLLDTDVVVPSNFLEGCLDELRGDVGGLLPYDRALCLDELSSCAVARALATGADLPGIDQLRGHVMSEVYGFAVAATREVYELIGGQDERYRGWGDEDNEFYFRLRENTEVRRRPGWIYHLDHPRPAMRIDGQRINAAAMSAPRDRGGVFGRLDRYEAEAQD